MNKNRILRFLCALALACALVLSALPARAGTNAYVKQTSAGKINLRSGPATQYRVLASLEPYTPLEVLSVVGKWAYVALAAPTAEGVREGYMFVDYIEYFNNAPDVDDDAIQPPQSAEYTVMYVNTGNSGRLNLREDASQNADSLGLFANGTRVEAMDLNNGWCFVQVNGLTGYMMRRFLSLTPPSPYDYWLYERMYVCLTSGRAALRDDTSNSSKMLGSFSNGTAVYVICDYGDWSYVYVGGLLGYMKNSVLEKERYIEPETPIGRATVQHPNGSFVYLRSSRTTDSLENVLAKVPSGEEVLVYLTDEWYSLIEYNGVKGYMVTIYLEMEEDDSDWTGPMLYQAMATSNARMYVSMNSNSAIVGVLRKGTIVEVYWEQQSWLRVKYLGDMGYVQSSYFERLFGN